MGARTRGCRIGNGPGKVRANLLAGVTRVLAVVAHPDDESFGLGGVLASLAAGGTRVGLLCFTRGEASTLGAREDLGEVRTRELREAAQVLGIAPSELLDNPDGGLDKVPVAQLADQVVRMAAAMAPEVLLTFDEGGVTGHPDHVAATRAALRAAPSLGVPVLGWAVPRRVAEALNAEFGTEFVGRDDAALDLVLTVDRAAQRRAIASHRTQAAGNDVLRRRLELLEDSEHLRWLTRPLPARR